MRARVALFALLLSLAAATAAPAAVTTKEIEESLTCQCGCGLTVHSCNHLQCGSAIPMKQEIAALVSGGVGRDEILLRFRDKYGEKILSSPTTEGFNLTAWVLPFVLIAAGGGALVMTVRRWASIGAESAAHEPPPAALSEHDRRRLDEELAKRS